VHARLCLIVVVDPPPLRDKQHWWILIRELARSLISPSRSTTIPNHQSLFTDRRFTVIAGPNLCNLESVHLTLSNRGCLIFHPDEVNDVG